MSKPLYKAAVQGPALSKGSQSSAGRLPEQVGLPRSKNQRFVAGGRPAQDVATPAKSTATPSKSSRASASGSVSFTTHESGVIGASGTGARLAESVSISSSSSSRSARLIPNAGQASAASSSLLHTDRPLSAALPEHVQRLQAQLLEGFDSGPESELDDERGAITIDDIDDPLCEAAILAAAGEQRLEDVMQLVLRDRGLTTLATPRVLEFARLTNLEVLSLSHNALVEISPLSNLVALVHLNISFNRIVDISPLYDCELLEKLFATHNQVATIEGLDIGCPQLSELSLFSNSLTDGPKVTQVLRRLPDLRVLDLGENDCCATPAQRFTLLQDMPKLESLNGQQLSNVDRRVATNFLDSAGKEIAADTSVSSTPLDSEKSVTEGIRPCTAPVVGARPPPMPSASSSSLNRGYPSSGPPVTAPLPGQRLRSSRANGIDAILTASREASPDMARRPFDVNNIDVRDPKRTLHEITVHAEALRRRLEIMQMERENLRFQVRLLERDRRESQSDELAAQVARLEEENRNARAVDTEHDDMHARIAQIDAELSRVSCPLAVAAGVGANVSIPSVGPKRTQSDDDEDEAVTELRWENKLLVKRLQQLTRTGEQTHQDMLRAQLQSGLKADSSLRNNVTASEPSAPSVSRNPDEVKAGSSDSDGTDAEIAQLLADNEATLRQLRGEVRDTATAMGRKSKREGSRDRRSFDPAARKSKSSGIVDVLTIGENGSRDSEWHHRK